MPSPIEDKARALAAAQDAVREGDINRAVAIATEALSRGHEDALFFNLRAFALEQQGRLNEALSDLTVAARLDPADAMVQNALGLCLTKLERWQDAIAAFQNAIRVAPDFHFAHFNLAMAQERIGELEDARQSYARTHELDPKAAEPLARLAALASRRADWTETERLANEALSIEPKHALAKTSLIKARMAAHDYGTAETMIEALLADRATPPFDHSFALSLKGDLCHTQKRYAEAFAAYTRSNEERRRLFAANFTRDDGVTAYNYSRWLYDYFSKADTNWQVASKPRPASAVRGHTFLIGFPRSGTTLLENILATNPAIVSLEEKEVLVDAVRAFLTQDGGPDRLEKAGETELDHYRKAYWKRVAGHLDVAGKIFIDKEPLATIKLPVIAKLFPGAKVLFAIRDPRDVVLSCFRRQFALNQSMYEFLTLEGAAKFYASVMELGEVYREKLGLDWHVVRHEAVVDDFEGETRKACDFLGVDWTEEMRHFAERARKKPIATPSATQVLRGLNRDGMAQWRHYTKELEPALPHLKPWIEKFGYPSK